MHKVVIDANVLVSAIFGGTSLKAVLKAFRKGRVVVSPQIERELIELPEKLRRKLNPIQIIEFKKLIRILFLKAERFQTKRRINISPHREDNAYLELCLASGADYLITGDKDLLQIPQDKLKEIGLENLKILTPSEFYRAEF